MRRPQLLAAAGRTRLRAAVAGLLLAAASDAVACILLVMFGADPTVAVAFGAGLYLGVCALAPALLRLRAEAAATSGVAPTDDVRTQGADGSLQHPVVLDLAAGLVRVRHELDLHRRRFAGALRSGQLWDLPDQQAADVAWAAARPAVLRSELAGLPLHDTVADAYAEVARTSRVRAARALAGAPVEVLGTDRLPAALAAVEQAVERIDVVLDVVGEDRALAAVVDLPPAERVVLDLTVDEPVLHRPRPELVRQLS